MPAQVPAYFDYLIEGFKAGHAARNVHLGYWTDPPMLTVPCDQFEFESAQARLTEIVVRLARLETGYRVLDVGCGFGGTFEAAARYPNLQLTGVNIDRRQLDICRTAHIGNSTLALVLADACALPFRSASFDRVFCIEAAFHFRSRDTFLRQVADVLDQGGRLVLSDILLRPPGAGAVLDKRIIEICLQDEYGPWPSPWIERGEIVDAADRAGLELEDLMDVTRNTLPTYRVTAPQDGEGLPDRISAGAMLRWLHANGFASYLCMSFVKR